MVSRRSRRVGVAHPASALAQTKAPNARPTLVGNVKATREDWLNLALDILVTDGVGSVRVLTLGQRLGVSRSSFYWYFESRQDLLDQLLAVWCERNTKCIVERAGRPAANVVRGVINILECWLDESLFDPRLDFAVRAWAHSSGRVRQLVDKADDERVAAIREMFARHGYDAENAFVRARVLYYTQIGHYSLDVNEPMDSRLSLVPAYLRSHTGQEPTQEDVADFRRFVETRLSRLAPASRDARSRRSKAGPKPTPISTAHTDRRHKSLVTLTGDVSFGTESGTPPVRFTLEPETGADVGKKWH